MGVLTLDRVTVRFGDTVAADAVSLTLPAGEVLAVLGPSGCGKSTVLRAVAGLERPESGSVRFDEEDLTAVPTHRRGFALMFQDGQLFPHLSVGANVGYPLKLRRVPRDRRHERVSELLHLVGLADYAARAPATLSGGERQRVALARALAVRPRLLLLDEPFSALDRDLRERLAGELRDILRAEHTTALLVTHDHDEAFAVADRMAVMRAGRVVQAGPVAEVWRSPADPETARFLGYARVVDAAVGARLLGEPVAGPVALRRSALRVDPGGSVPGVVTTVRATPEVTRLAVQVPEAGVVDAVAGLDARVVPGDRVMLTVDTSRLAVLPVAEPS